MKRQNGYTPMMEWWIAQLENKIYNDETYRIIFLPPMKENTGYLDMKL